MDHGATRPSPISGDTAPEEGGGGGLILYPLRSNARSLPHCRCVPEAGATSSMLGLRDREDANGGSLGSKKEASPLPTLSRNPPTRGLPSHPEGGCAAAGMIRGVDAAQAGHHWSPYAAAAAAASSSGGGPRGPLAGVCRWGWTQSHGKREITWKGFPKLYVIHQSSTAGTAHSPEGDRPSCDSFHSCCSLFSSSLIPTPIT